jgi:DHA1 family bicyclomycin/chloramphenicol resistance-like MFS transporter
MNMMSPLPVAKPAEPIMSERRVSLLGGMLIAIGPISMALYTPAMPEITAAFGTTASAVKLTLSAYFAGFAFSQLICGPLSDGFGRKPITLAFMGLYLAASILALFAPNIEILIVARLLQGAGAAVGVAISRAIVRDLFTHERSARIMNMMGIILAVGPAFSPVIGGLVMEAFGWHAVFLVMVAGGLAIVLGTIIFMRETVVRDLSRIRPAAILRSYGALLTSRYFMTAALLIGCTVGALYTLATMLPFLLIDRVGLTATQFGLSMLLQSGSYFFGAVAARMLMPRVGSRGLVPIGLCFIATGAILLAVLTRMVEPSLATIMGPVALYAAGIAFVMPAMMTATVAPFPHIAGAASALAGFFQMGSGLAGSFVAVLIGDPVIAIGWIIPAMGLMAVCLWLAFRSMPDPVGGGSTVIAPEPITT